MLRILKRMIDNVFEYFSGNRSLISGTICSFLIKGEDGLVSIEVVVQLMYAKTDKRIKLIFADVLEYSFYHRREHDFYNIVDLKFFKQSAGYYVSFDPDYSTSQASANDNDFISAASLEAFVVELMF